MTLIGDREIAAGESVDPAEALIREARQLRRHRWGMWSSIVVVAIGVASALYAAVSDGGKPSAPSVTTGVAGSAAGSPTATVSAPANPRSEVVTISTGESIAGKPQFAQLTREAVTLGGVPVSAQYLTSEDITYGPYGREVSPNGQDVIANGVQYQPASWNLQGPQPPWTATRLTSRVGWVAVTDRSNNFRVYRSLSLGPVVAIGHTNIAGIPTTKYRLTLSIIKLTMLRESEKSAFIAPILTNAILNGAGTSPLLTSPEEIWVDAKGNVIQIESTTTVMHATSAAVGAPIKPTTRWMTITLSNFGVPVHVVPPPADEVRFENAATRPVQTQATGQVLVRDREGRLSPVAGVLLLTSTEHYEPGLGPGLSKRADQGPRFVAVRANGTYSAAVPATSQSYDTSVSLSAVFYPNPTTKSVCTSYSGEHFRLDSTTSSINFICGSEKA